MRFVRALVFLGPIMAVACPSAVVAQQATREMVDAALPKLEAYVSDLIAADAVPGMSVAVVYKGDVVYLWGFGTRQEGKDAPVDADTVFQVASFSKPMSSTIVAALVGEGAVSWDSRIADIDPAFQLRQPYPSTQVTVRDLFAHRSGLPGNAGNELEGLGYPRDEILNRLRLVEPSSSFRAGYSYSNFGLTEGAVAAAGAAGLGWEEAADAKLFEPLGMTSSSYRYADFLAHENRAELHVRYRDAWQPLAKRQPDAQAPAGGASSSARDLARWMQLVLGGGEIEGTRLIEESALAQTHVPVITRGVDPQTGRASFYALGWSVQFGPYGMVWGHAGAFSAGARSIVSLLPESDLGIVVLSNAFPTGAPDAVADTFFDLVFGDAPAQDWLEVWNARYDSLFTPAIEAAAATYGTPPAAAAPALPASAYLGTYDNDYLGQAVVAEQDGGLVLRLGPDGVRQFPLTHFDRDLFTYVAYDEMPDFKVAATFLIGPDGKASQVTLEDLDDLGMGTLVRTDP